MSFLTAIWAMLCTAVFNTAFDYTYVKLPITLLIMYFSAFFCIFLINKYEREVSFDVVTKYFLAAIALQSAFSILQFLSSDIANFLTSIQRISTRQLLISESHFESGTRFIGFGLVFYTASFFYGTALVLIAFILRYRKQRLSLKWFYLLFYIIVFFIGMGLSRTTIIGFICSILILFFPLNSYTFSIKKILATTIIFLVLTTILSLFSKTLFNISINFDALINNAFDFIISFIETGQLQSTSASATFDKFLVFPEHLKTYLVGTGIYESRDPIGDFTYSDIGYLRLIYYFGLPGTFLVLLIEIFLLKTAFYRKNYSPIFYATILILLITNIKGLTTLAMISTLYALIPNSNRSAK